MVADHSKALLLKNNGSAVSPQLEVKRVIEAGDNPLTHEQGTDRPGKVSAGSHRSAVEQTDWHAIAGRRFLEQVAGEMAKAQAAEQFSAVALIAPPKALAELRSAISASLRATVVGELGKDLTNMPVDDIAAYLAA
jgi:protein required for attachment to host cells